MSFGPNGQVGCKLLQVKPHISLRFKQVSHCSLTQILAAHSHIASNLHDGRPLFRDNLQAIEYVSPTFNQMPKNACLEKVLIMSLE